MRNRSASVLGVGGSRRRRLSASAALGVAAAAMRGRAASVLGVGGGGSRRRRPSARDARHGGGGNARPRRGGPRHRRRRHSARDLRRGGGGYAQPRVVGPRRLSAAGMARRGPTCLWAVLGPSLLHFGLARPVLARSMTGWHGPSPISTWMRFNCL